MEKNGQGNAKPPRNCSRGGIKSNTGFSQDADIAGQIKIFRQYAADKRSRCIEVAVGESRIVLDEASSRHVGGVAARVFDERLRHDRTFDIGRVRCLQNGRKPVTNAPANFDNHIGCHRLFCRTHDMNCMNPHWISPLGFELRNVAHPPRTLRLITTIASTYLELQGMRHRISFGTFGPGRSINSQVTFCI